MSPQPEATSVGIPGSLSGAVKRLRWFRLNLNTEAFTANGADYVRFYGAGVADGMLRAIVSHEPFTGKKNGLLLWHLSVSHKGGQLSLVSPCEWPPDSPLAKEPLGIEMPDRLPSWDELKHAKYTLVPEDVCMEMIFPRREAKYVNIASTCMHLWQSDTHKDV